jgi:hypothetical protein
MTIQRRLLDTICEHCEVFDLESEAQTQRRSIERNSQLAWTIIPFRGEFHVVPTVDAHFHQKLLNFIEWMEGPEAHSCKLW